MDPAEQEVVEQGKFTQIPDEIYLNIAQHLSNLERICLASTCRRFKNLEEEELDDLTWSLDHDDAFTLSCYGERQNEPNYIDQKNCSGCQETHDIGCFDLEELRVDGTRRYCRGQAGIVKIHPTLSMKWTDFERAMSNYDNGINWPAEFFPGNHEFYEETGFDSDAWQNIEILRWPGPLRSDSINTSDPHIFWLLERRPMEVLAYCTSFKFWELDRESEESARDNIGFLSYWWHLKLEIIDRIGFIAAADVADEIRSRKIDFDICPHMSMAHPKITRAIANSAFIGVSYDEVIFRCDSCATFGRVLMADSFKIPGTSIELEEPLSMIQVQRALGERSYTPNHAAWLYQLGEDKPIDNNREDLAINKVYSDGPIGGIDHWIQQKKARILKKMVKMKEKYPELTYAESKPGQLLRHSELKEDTSQVFINGQRVSINPKPCEVDNEWCITK